MRIIDYLPPVLRDIGDYSEIAGAEQERFGGFDSALGDRADDLFIFTLTEHGIERWEKLLDITPKSADTLEVRRFRIFAKLSEQTPYTMAALREKQARLCGEDGYTADITPADYTLTVRVALSARGEYEAVTALIERMAPANLIADVSLLYNQHLMFAGYAHAQLGEYTHYELRNEEME